MSHDERREGVHRLAAPQNRSSRLVSALVSGDGSDAEVVLSSFHHFFSTIDSTLPFFKKKETDKKKEEGLLLQ